MLRLNLDIPKFSLNKREKILLIILSITAFIYIYFFLLIFPLQDSIDFLNNEIAEEKQNNINFEAKKNKLEKLQKELDESNNALKVMEQEVNLNISMPSILSDLDTAALINDLQIVSLSLSDMEEADIGNASATSTASTSNKDSNANNTANSANSSGNSGETADDKAPNSNDPYKEFPINLIVRGTYSNILRYMEYIENNQKKIIIKKFSFKPKSSEKEFDVVLSLVTYISEGANHDTDTIDNIVNTESELRSFPYFVDDASVEEDSIPGDENQNGIIGNNIQDRFTTENGKIQEQQDEGISDYNQP